MEMLTLKAEPREAMGTASSRRLRREGKVPCVLYGHNQEVFELSVAADALNALLAAGHHVIALDVNGKPERAMVKAVQANTWDTETLHVDFVRVGLHETVHVSVEVTSHGTPKAVLAGGILEQPLHALEIECDAAAIPDDIRVEIGHLEASEMIHVRDIPPIEGVAFVTDPNAVVFIVHERRGAEEEEEAPVEGEAQAEPEVIGRSAKADDEASSQEDA